MTVPSIIGANATGVRLGCALLALSLATLALNVAKMLSHFIKPSVQPLVMPATPTPHPV